MLAGLHHRDERDGEGKRICTFDLMHVTHPLCWLSYALKNGGDEECRPLCLSHVKRALC